MTKQTIEIPGLKMSIEPMIGSDGEPLPIEWLKIHRNDAHKDYVFASVSRDEALEFAAFFLEAARRIEPFEQQSE